MFLAIVFGDWRSGDGESERVERLRASEQRNGARAIFSGTNRAKRRERERKITSSNKG